MSTHPDRWTIEEVPGVVAIFAVWLGISIAPPSAELDAARLETCMIEANNIRQDHDEGSCKPNSAKPIVSARLIAALKRRNKVNFSIFKICSNQGIDRCAHVSGIPIVCSLDDDIRWPTEGGTGQTMSE